MPRRLLVVAALLALASTSCFTRPSAAPPPPASPTASTVEAIGNLGTTAGGAAGQRYGISVPNRQRGDRMTVALRSEAPGRPADVAFVLLVRLTPDNPTTRVDTATGDGASHWEYDFAGTGKPLKVRYEIRHGTGAETFVVGGKELNPDDGRVVLIDLRASPATVRQVKFDVTGLVPVGQEPAHADFDKAEEKLAADGTIAAFLR
jgi:hypothetical protein